jgi:UDP-N-acetylmuramate dehydrogenase
MRNGPVAPLAQELLLIPGLKLKLNEPLARYTSIKIGGPADLFLEIPTTSALAQSLRLLNQHHTPFLLLGKGSNVLISDRGVRGAVLRLGGDFRRAEWRAQKRHVSLIVGAAYPVALLARESVRKGFAGLEFAEGIPATVGGAIVMNAGAYGSEMEKVVARIEGLTPKGEEKVFGRGDLSFSYRSTHLPQGFIVTCVWFALSHGDTAEMQEKMRALVAKRKHSQPAGFPNAGSMFRNPPGDFAGRLIEAAGLKGHAIGQAKISERHANFIVNLGGARAEDVKKLMDRARAEVKKKFAAELMPEIHLVGEWPQTTEAK